MTTKKNKPIDTIRDGAIKATIWANDSQNGTFYSVEFARTYEQGDQLRDSHSFSGSEPLKVARLAQKAYDRIDDLKKADVEAANGGSS